MNSFKHSQNEKMLIVHADDAGLSHSQNRAIMEALQFGIVNSYSIMATCPWFFEIADFAKTNTIFDYGVHLTLTCEWEKYKFGPVMPIEEVPSLVDGNGYFHTSLEDFKSKAKVEEVKKELLAQIEKVIRFGLTPTHLDSHMLAMAAGQEFLDVYIELGEIYDLPILLNEQFLIMMGLDSTKCKKGKTIFVDNVHMANDFEDIELSGYYDYVLDNLEQGLNVLLVHPAFDDNEMKGITQNHPHFGSKWRQKDYDYFTSADCKSKIGNNNIKLITWSNVKNILRE